MNVNTLICIHGSGDSARCWDPLLASMGDAAASLLALDLPGHGARAQKPPPQPSNVAAYADALLADLDQRALDAVTLVGHSLGSAIALHLALAAPTRVRGLVLVGAGARLRVLPAILELARTDPPAAHRQLVMLGHAPGHEALAARYLEHALPFAPGALHGDLAACDGFDVMEQLAQVRQPALVVVGESDRLTPPKYAAYLAEHLPASTLAVIPDAGHSVMHEAPEALAQHLTAWLAGREA